MQNMGREVVVAVWRREIEVVVAWGRWGAGRVVGGWHRGVGSRGIDLICKLVLTFTKCNPVVTILVYFWLTTRTYPIRLTILGCNKYIGQYKWDSYILFHIILSIFLFPFFSLQCDCLILSWILSSFSYTQLFSMVIIPIINLLHQPFIWFPLLDVSTYYVPVSTFKAFVPMLV